MYRPVHLLGPVCCDFDLFEVVKLSVLTRGLVNSNEETTNAIGLFSQSLTTLAPVRPVVNIGLFKRIKHSGLDTSEGERGNSSTLSYLDQCTFAMRKESRSCLKHHDQGNSIKILFSPHDLLRDDEG